MKFVVSRDIANVPKLGLKPDSTQKFTFPVPSPNLASGLPAHIHKGTRITIGDSEKADELSPEAKEKVLWLHHSKAVVLASDKAVERIDREVEQDIKRHHADKASGPKSLEATVTAGIAAALPAAIVQTLAAMGIKPKVPVET